MYCTEQDLETRFGADELDTVAWDPDTGARDTEKITRACQDATETINAYIGAIATVPLAEPVPEVIVRLACDMARYRLHDNNPLDEVTKRFEAALRMLRDFSDGKAVLQLATTESSADVYAQRDEHDRTFTRETLADF
ncbi:MAG: DUF1320 domain-containing protein [Pseudomonadota bacterium]